jgi:hypothetical protein
LIAVDAAPCSEEEHRRSELPSVSQSALSGRRRRRAARIAATRFSRGVGFYFLPVLCVRHGISLGYGLGPNRTNF